MMNTTEQLAGIKHMELDQESLSLDEIVGVLASSTNLSQCLADDPSIRERVLWLTNDICKKAFSGPDNSFLKVAHRTLFTLYQAWLAEPLSAQAQNQYHPLLTDIRNRLESKWIEAEKIRSMGSIPSLTVRNIVEELRKLCFTHPASYHPLFDFLASSASVQQIHYFFKSDSALNLLFFDLVAMNLVGSFPETRGEISRNLWDEIGEGSNEFTHVNLYKDLLKRRNITLPEDHYTHLYDWQGLAGYNVFMLGGVTRQHYYKSLGVMAMTEMLDPPQYHKLVEGCRRVGLSDRDVHYYSEHITVDIGHADGWLNNVIVPIGKLQPQSLTEVYFGAILRLQTCQDYYNHLLEQLHRL